MRLVGIRVGKEGGKRARGQEGERVRSEKARAREKAQESESECEFEKKKSEERGGREGERVCVHKGTRKHESARKREGARVSTSLKNKNKKGQKMKGLLEKRAVRAYLCQRFGLRLKVRRWAFNLGLFPLHGRW